MLTSTLGYRIGRSLFSLEWGHLHQGQWVDYTLPLSEGVPGIPGLLSNIAELMMPFKFDFVQKQSWQCVCPSEQHACLGRHIKGKAQPSPRGLETAKAEFLRLDFFSFMKDHNCDFLCHGPPRN